MGSRAKPKAIFDMKDVKKFQKDYVVWKLCTENIKFSSYTNLFQKHYVVWKPTVYPPLTFEKDVLSDVSEALCSLTPI